MTEGAGPLYRAERGDDPQGGWRVTGPNGIVGTFASEREAQAKADALNAEVAEEREDDA